ncbi:MAG: hypothetical protein HZA54_15730 [Planctomycetes bacterium]|nr:hypothetical protein [Planctomycetota bacterium]
MAVFDGRTLRDGVARVWTIGAQPVTASDATRALWREAVPQVAISAMLLVVGRSTAARFGNELPRVSLPLAAATLAVVGLRLRFVVGLM